MGQPEKLFRLAARTRELVEELDRARPDLLSLTELNRALRHILATQAAILEALAQDDGAPASALPAPSGSASRHHIRVTPSGAEKRGPARIDLDPGELEDPILDLEPVQEDLVAPPKPAAPARDESSSSPRPGANGNGASAPAESAGQAADATAEALPPGASSAEAWRNEKRTVPNALARQFVCQFDNRDKDYDKGLDKLNRWISAGSSGTPFQWRGDQAYLNLNGSAASTARNYEDQLMTRMGFSRRLGRLDVPGLAGEIMIYERPS